VRDIDGNKGNTSLELKDVLKPIILEYTVKNPECYKENGEINLQATGGCSKLEFSFDAGNTWSAKNKATKLGAYTYDVMVRDASGNVEKKQIELAQPENCNIKSIDFSELIERGKMDDNDKEYCKFYPTFQLSNPIKAGSKWYYADHDLCDHNLQVKVRPDKYFEELQLEAKGPIEICNINNSKNPIMFSLEAKGNGKVEGREKNETQVIDGLNVIDCKQKNININIYLIKRKNGKALNVNRTSINSYLTNFMKAINITPNINYIEKEIDYALFDKNNNKIIDKPERFDPNSEANLLSTYDFDPNIEAFRIIILDNIKIGRPELSENEFVAGYASTDFRANYYDPIEDWQKLKESVITSTYRLTSINSTIMHEIGHFIFGLGHPFTEFKAQGFTPGTDVINIMDYLGNTLIPENDRKLRAYQVQFIQKELNK
jgi:hypothetical protein